ncbi:MAG: hypothetical protein AAGG47_20285 [Pseudomonadota bacterium]
MRFHFFLPPEFFFGSLVAPNGLRQTDRRARKRLQMLELSAAMKVDEPKHRNGFVLSSFRHHDKPQNRIQFPIVGYIAVQHQNFHALELGSAHGIGIRKFISLQSDD